jgi:hypothetical protein
MYRGSSSESARKYKADGHVNETAFAKLIGGTTEGLPPQGKTDCVGPLGETYSVKKQAKKWQIFLYGLDRLVNDPGFRRLADKGLELSNLVQSFPNDYVTYARDKDRAKAQLRSLMSEDRSGFDISRFIKAHKDINEYVGSKVKLSEVTGQLCHALSALEMRRDFLHKAMFNGVEVSHLAVQDGTVFRIFSAKEVTDVFAQRLTVAQSGTGGHKDDLSIAGQKILMRSEVNVVELEVRNDSEKHYRQLRFNMNRNAAVALLIDSIPVASKSNQVLTHALG